MIRTDFSNTKPGDKFAVSTRAGYSRATVERVTKTMIVTDRGRFSRNVGVAVGGDMWTTGHLMDLDHPSAVAGFAKQKHHNLTSALIKATEDYRSNPTTDTLTAVTVAAQKVADNNYTPDA